MLFIATRGQPIQFILIPALNASKYAAVLKTAMLIMNTHKVKPKRTF